MSFPVQAERTDTNVPVTFVIDTGTTGLTVTVRVRDGSTTNSYLDFSDNTFKTSGWTSQTSTLTDINSGFYALAGGLNLAAMTNLPTTTHTLLLEFVVTGAFSGSAVDIIQVRTSVHDIPLDLLIRSLSGTEPSITTERSLAGMLQKHVNRVRVNGAVIEIYQTDDATLAWSQNLTTSAVAEPIIEVDTA